MRIRKAIIQDMEAVFRLEKEIEQGSPASKETLRSRFFMFPEGFLVAEEDGHVVGYIESCRWESSNFHTFEEIRDFPRHHRPWGRILYIIFVGVKEEYRRRGIGSELVRRLQKYAAENGLEKVQLVAGGDSLLGFYRKLGFEAARDIPRFSSYVIGKLLEWRTGNNKRKPPLKK